MQKSATHFEYSQIHIYCMLDDTENKKTKRQLILSNYINKYTQEERDTTLKTYTHIYIHYIRINYTSYNISRQQVHIVNV